jgi:hypothetical protein
MPSRKTPAAAPSVGQPKPAPAMRLIFEYDGDAVRLVSQQPVDMAITGADLAQVHAPGTFVDARDAKDRTVARVHARGISEGMVEVFPEKPGQPIMNVTVDRPRGAFTVVLPAPKEAAKVAVVRVKRDSAARAAATPGAEPALQTTELGSFALQRKP